MKDIIKQNQEYEKQIEELKRQQEELKFLAFHDALTGAYNRNWFYQNIKSNSKVYLTMVDLNKLKLINDTLGHTRGDKLILEVAHTLSNYGDVIRFGGDEFIVISKNEKQFERLNNLKSKKFSYGGVKPHEYTCISSAIKKADERLYTHKQKQHKQFEEEKVSACEDIDKNN